MAMVPVRSPAVPVVATVMILALLACAEVAAAEGQTICDTAKCGMGTCREAPGLIPLTTSYNCTCHPGWTQPKVLDIPPLPFAPCIIPDCPFDPSCFNLSLALPKGIPLTDPCVAINCGPGECKKGEGFSYSCDCDSGYANFLNLTAFPCVKSCVFGTSCSKLGITPPPPPPPPPSTAPPPGSVPSSWRLLQLLLILSLAMVQLM
ncbi:unnamed protein product [Urochloa decumbens]|uniref:EGF-like domain-containing protein n=1 Tax=Urochloa decumbens TaxID=240449 RepID=A0ABC8XEJ8_9POAL